MHASDVHCSTSRELGLCGLDLSEPEANNSRRVIGVGKARCIARFPRDSTACFL